MAIEIKFKCLRAENDFLTVSHDDTDKVFLIGECNGQLTEFVFDISTAIKFAKTVRTEINKAKEVHNG